MDYLKRFGKLPANSILESVIALAIIAVCLSIAVMVYAAVFNPRTSARFYKTQNEMNEMFFVLQIHDTMLTQSDFKTNSTTFGNMEEVDINYSDSVKIKAERHFYLLKDE